MGFDAPPVFLTAAGHPLRWRLLGALAHSDHAVHELTALLGQPQNLVSYHLAKLRKAALVTTRRSTADGRDTYYRLDLAHCARLLAGAGAELHPGLRLRPPAEAPAADAGVLFLCTGNSARSQMAEALLRRRTAGRIDVVSAGSHPKPIHPQAVAVMADRGIDLATHRAKHLDEITGRRFDRVVTLCDRVKEICPEFPGAGAAVHWSTPDPARDASGRQAFEKVADDLDERIAFLLHTLRKETS